MAIQPECCKEFPLEDALKNELSYEAVAPVCKFEENPVQQATRPTQGFMRSTDKMAVHPWVSILNYGFPGA